MSHDEVDQLERAYECFADQEAKGRSPLYVELAHGVADDVDVLAALAELPAAKRQPNLLFTAVRHLCGEPAGWAGFRELFWDQREQITELMLKRRTQTNEPARCATLLPLLATLPQPLALIEVGASAGLCLLMDRYAYDFGRRRIPAIPPARDAPVFACRANDHTPLPTKGVEVAWRAGLDLDPVDVADPDSVAWLESLVWPGEGRRLELLRAAIAVAQLDPPRIVKGDLRHDLRALADQAPADATLVIFHTAVLSYLTDTQDRRAFGDDVRTLGARWVANEGEGVIDGSGHAPPWPSGRFLLMLDGEQVAWTDPHGASVDWLPPTASK